MLLLLNGASPWELEGRICVRFSYFALMEMTKSLRKSHGLFFN